MLKNCKISRYKIKKILKCFTEDLTVVEASELLRFNRKTITRYYNLFRKVIYKLGLILIRENFDSVKCIGWIKGSYGDKSYLKIYKLNDTVFFCIRSSKKPEDLVCATVDESFSKYLAYIHNRFSKFRGLKGRVYFYQLFECIVKYNYTEVELFNQIWPQIKKCTLAKELF